MPNPLFSPFRGGRALVLWFALCLVLGGCQHPMPPFPGDSVDAPAARAARAIVERAAEAHGGMQAYDEIQGIAAGFAGKWLGNVHRLQPVLVDRDFRVISQERYLLRTAAGAPLSHPVVGQRHDGEGGSKWVRWQGASVPVGIAYRGQDGEPVAPHGIAREVTETSALVAEAYRMFLTGPFFFLERDRRPEAQTHYAPAEDDLVDGVACAQALVRIRPGIGLSEEDLVLVAVGRDDGLLRRLRFSLEGHSGTRGAVVDVTFQEWEERGGLRWPTSFLETLRFPLDRDVHRWRTTSLSVLRVGKRSLGPASATVENLTPAAWTPPATGRAEPVRALLVP